MQLTTFKFIDKNKYCAKYFYCYLGWQRPKGKGLFLNLKILESSEAYFFIKSITYALPHGKLCPFHFEEDYCSYGQPRLLVALFFKNYRRNSYGKT
jgi:hypothetical protein